MLTESNYIDIHSHKEKSNHFVIRNLFPESIDKMDEEGHFSIGWHPWHLSEKQAALQMSRVKSVASDPSIVAIGETGLDKLADAPLNFQINIFKQHVSIAEKSGKPLIIHAVKTFEEIIRIKKEMNSSGSWIIHGFNKKPEVAEMLLNEGFMLSFGKALLDERTPAFEVIKNAPADRVFLETDDSDLAIGTIYEKAALARKEDLVTLKRNIYNNFKTHFLQHG